MTNTLARIKKAGKNFEIIVDLDSAVAFKKGQIPSIEPESNRIFKDSKKGDTASDSDLEEAFGTTDIYEIAARIVKEGEVQLTQEYRDESREKKIKQVVDFLVNNAMDPQSGNPHTPERIRSSLEQAGVNIKDVPIDKQIGEIVEKLSKILPIKIDTKKIKVTIPAMHTGRAYGVVNPYKSKENWKDNGDLEVMVSIPAGMVMDFYDKLNGVTHGSALTEEIREE